MKTIICFVPLLIALLYGSAGNTRPDKETEARRLLDRAAELSDLWKDGPSPFRFSASVRVIDAQGQVHQGTYQMLRASKERWREELSLPGYEEVRVRSGDSLRALKPTEYPVYWRALLTTLLRFSDFLKLPEHSSGIRFFNRTEDGLNVRCVKFDTPLASAAPGSKSSTYCIDTATGTLAWFKDPYNRRYDFQDYIQFNGKRVPRSATLRSGKKTVMQLILQALEVPEDIPATAFVPPMNAVEEPPAFVCDGESSAPERTHHVYPVYPRSARIRRIRGIVTTFVIIGTDGKVHNATVVQSPDPSLSQSVVEALQQWEYRPATCNGKHIPIVTYIDTTFRF